MCGRERGSSRACQSRADAWQILGREDRKIKGGQERRWIVTILQGSRALNIRKAALFADADKTKKDCKDEVRIRYTQILFGTGRYPGAERDRDNSAQSSSRAAESSQIE